eukprot:80634-Chlamydomonas_euryale.AAC.1
MYGVADPTDKLASYPAHASSNKHAASRARAAWAMCTRPTAGDLIRNHGPCARVRQQGIRSGSMGS